MKKTQNILICIFLLFLLFPLLLWPIAKPFLDSENHENRELAEFPSLAEEGWGFFSAFDTYFTDHLPFKNQLTRLHSEVFLSLFNTTSSPRVVVGKDRWLFYNNYDAENPLDDVLGLSAWQEPELEQIADNLTDVKQRLEEQGIEFVFALCPNKESIYQEYLPDYLAENAVEKTRSDEMYAYLTQQGIDMVYPKDSLLEAKENALLYYRYDTHWNKLGGYLGFREICAELGVTLPPLQELSVSEHTGYPKDLAQLAGIGAISNNDAEYAISDFMPSVTVTHVTEDPVQRLNHYTSDAEDPRTVLLIHDSYSGSMMEYFPKVFCEVIAVHRNYSDLYSVQQYIDQYDCDVVVMQVVERGAQILLHDNMPY